LIGLLGGVTAPPDFFYSISPLSGWISMTININRQSVNKIIHNSFPGNGIAFPGYYHNSPGWQYQSAREKYRVMVNASIISN
jgi:hypothetical protein